MATIKPRSKDEYTIGWVCALPKEQTAATAMLDAKHPAIQTPSSDPNNYTLGSIGNHNVVIACLPKGQIGTNSAATVATWMVSTFSNIKFGLMVGIGGGIPPKVRLGDVVVGTPVGQFPGVVQWDMGKAEKGGFERTGSLNNPPTFLLTALSKLETEHELVGSKIPDYLEALRKNWPRLVSKYLRSDSLEDILFKADYGHVSKSTGDDENEDEEEENCRLCGTAGVIKRKSRDARVHYGLIASGNQVIKNGIFRNNLNKELGGQVLCVEMEAAGLVNNFPCVVIRGICDYADSHKNYNWQEHAAVMAAALAKELLQYVLPNDVGREPSVKDRLNEVHDIVSKTGADVAQMTSIIERDEDLKFLNWLTPRDYGLQQNKYIQAHQEGTGRWLLDSAKFITWVETNRQTLFCPGMPGAGKTILTSIVVDNLTSRFGPDPSVGIAYIYFNFWQQDEHKVEDLFASLLKQLVRGKSSLPASVKDLCNHHMEKGTRPSLDKISKVLQSVIRVSYSRVFIIIDALDECQASDNCRTQFIKGLFDFQKCGANIFATSRSIPDVTDKFDGSTRLEIRASDDDIRRYVDGQISYGESETLRDMQAEASTGIMRAADGMFLLAKLDLDSLLDEKLPKDMRAKLKNLPKGSKAYSHAYEAIMRRIEHQGPGSVRFAKAVLSWITCAKRPLTISELRHALAVEIGESKLNEKDLPPVQDLVSVCAGLVTVDEGSAIIRLFHYTAQEYFQQTQNQWFPDAKDDITRICVTYLSFDVFEDGFCPTDAAFEERLQSYQLYDYAAHEWGHHACESISLDPLVLDFLQCQSKVEASSQALFAVKESGKPNYSQDLPKQMTGLHLAAYFGIEKAIQFPLDLNGWDPEDGYNRTPLSLAAENGHETVVRLLINKGANPKAMDHLGLTPLSWATQGGHEAIVRLLNTSSQELPSQPAAGDSASNDSQPAVAANADRELQKFNLMLKSVQMIRRNKQNEKEQQLLSQKREGINVQLRQIKRQQKLVEEDLRKVKMRKAFLAEEENDTTGEMYHLDKVQAELTEKQEQLPKQWIYTQTRLDELRQMDGYEHEHELEEIRDSILFRWAVEDGYAEVVELLLDGGTDATAANKDGWMPLHAAVSKGHVEVVRLLLDMGKVDIDSKDDDGWTAYQLAAERENEDIVQLLLKKGANTDAAIIQCQQTLQGHSYGVNSVAFSHNSKLLASGSNDETVKIWNITTGQCQQTLQGHSSCVNSVAFSHNSKLLASGSNDETVKIWNITTGQCQRTLQGHSDSVNSVAFSHDSKLLVSGSDDKTIKIWKITTGQCQQTLQGHRSEVRSVAFSHNSKLLASAGDGAVKIWNTNTGQCQQTLQSYIYAVNSVAFSHDSKLLASGLGDGIIKLWNITTGQCQQILQGHRQWIRSVAFHNSKLLASGSGDGTVKIWNTNTGQCQQTLRDHRQCILSVAFSHDLMLLASGSGDTTIKLWNVPIGVHLVS
ncbi:hypothetical protein CFAM422_003493 [Trichoderma lentiforme]|uniref:Nucleoside phosphorylase domain-containing protein n=1 Tax=Trichoderma lentiforme TaxID=1567552 RepID=A0A9P5CE77_9HYPO|nr:hypothetical protein CFAM422_003493 [Trichoderma lentiforme]